MYLYKRNQKQKLTFADHVLRGFSGESIQYSTLQILEGKMNSKVAQERPSRMLLDDIKHWTKLNNYEDIRRTAEDRRRKWRTCTTSCQHSVPEDDS